MTVNEDEKTKDCPECGHKKPLDSFGNNKSRPDGKQVYCLECKREMNRKWNNNNREKKRESDRKYQKSRELTEEDKKRQREYARKHYQQNKEYYIEKSRKRKERVVDKNY